MQVNIYDWLPIWDKLLAGSGVTQSLNESPENKMNLVYQALDKYHCRLVRVGSQEVILEFDHAHDWVQFQLTWS
jgi:hypothetical protein